MTDENALIDAALAGDEKALGKLLASVQDQVFNLALRMLGTVPDAEDATQEVLVKACTRLSGFRRESAFSTWVFRIALNHLATYRKGLFAQRPVSFDVYGEDIASGREHDVPDLAGGADRSLLERELKVSCMHGMLQCLDVEGRSAFVLGTMFKMDSRAAADALGITPEAYRQRLSRARARHGRVPHGLLRRGRRALPLRAARGLRHRHAPHRSRPPRLPGARGAGRGRLRAGCGGRARRGPVGRGADRRHGAARRRVGRVRVAAALPLPLRCGRVRPQPRGLGRVRAGGVRMSAAKGAGADAGMGAALAYLAELEAHNDRAWFAETKAERAGALAAFDVLVADVQQRVGAFDPAVLGHDPKKLTFKLTRDTRFSNDKSPYNPSLRAHVGPAGEAARARGLLTSWSGRAAARFWEEGRSQPCSRIATDRVRRAIAADGDAWERVVEGLAPLQVEGEALKRVPQGFDAAHPQAGWLKFKSWYLELPVPDEDVAAPGFAEAASREFERVKPLNDFLNRALEGFEMPAR